MNRYYAYITKVTDLKEDLKKSLEFVQWRSYVKTDSTVFIKPNFTFPYYKEGITTNPVLLKNLLEIIQDRAQEVIVGESNGGNHSFTADEAFEGHDLVQICRDTGVRLVNLSKLPSIDVQEKIQGKNVKVQLPRLLLEDIDCFISVPVLKVHVMTNVTLSIKNLWGCYPDTMRCLHHKHLSHKLALIAKRLDPKLVVIDGIYALDSHGPMYGEAKKLDLIISSNNPVVADSLGSAVMGTPLSKVEHIRLAEREGLGTTDLSQVVVNDDWIKHKVNFKVNKTTLDKLSWILFNSELCAKIVMDSPVRPLIYGMATKLRNKDEQEVADMIEKQKR